MKQLIKIYGKCSMNYSNLKYSWSWIKYYCWSMFWFRKKSCKKFDRKFSDYVYGFSKQTDDSRPWREKVDEAFILAYQAAKHKFNKECGNVLKRFTCDVLGGVIINDLITKIVETVGNLIGTLTSQIPNEVKEMVNLEEMAKDDVRDILTGTFEGAVYDQNNAFEEELNKAIENCQI